MDNKFHLEVKDYGNANNELGIHMAGPINATERMRQRCYTSQLSPYQNHHADSRVNDSQMESTKPPHCTDKSRSFAQYAFVVVYNRLLVTKHQLEPPKNEETQKFGDEQLKELRAIK